jgi:hypothetical protein
MPGKGKKGTYNYGRAFYLDDRKVAYRYVNKDKRTKTLVDYRSKKPIKRSRGDAYRFRTKK